MLEEQNCRRQYFVRCLGIMSFRGRASIPKVFPVVSRPCKSSSRSWAVQTLNGPSGPVVPFFLLSLRARNFYFDTFHFRYY
ncbi:hypothetical protein VTK56DRAFT_2825 [Thermocarpiscus australiensis]